METISDEEFFEKLKKFLGLGPEDLAPVFKETDGSINRERTLELVVYDGFTE